MKFNIDGQIYEHYEGDGDENGYVVVCKHIASKTRPVLHVEFSDVYDEKHSGWEAICNTGEGDCDVDDYVEWPMETFLDYEPTLGKMLKDRSEFVVIHRKDKDSQWEKVK